MKILVAPDSFKGSMSSATAGDAVRKGILRAFPSASVSCFCLADGGEGTAYALSSGAGLCCASVVGPYGSPVSASFYMVSSVAYIDCASAIGLPLVPSSMRHPLRLTSYGLGQLISAAVDMGASSVVVGLGGSATVDCGLGMLCALGARVYSGSSVLSMPYPSDFMSVTSVDLSAVSLPSVVVLSDVSNPLLGDFGAAPVFGPQKGATAAEVSLLTSALAHVAPLISSSADVMSPGCGAAGGLGFAFRALGADFVPGAEYVISHGGIETCLRSGVDLVVTGEGRFDRSSLSGKAAYTLGCMASSMGVPAVLFAGSAESLSVPFDVCEIGGSYDFTDPAASSAALESTVFEYMWKL